MNGALYAPVIRNYQPPQKRVPRKCSTCGNTACAVRFGAVDWMKCAEWTPPAIEDAGGSGGNFA